MPQDHQRIHGQLSKVLEDEEIVELEHKGTVAKYKLDHRGKHVFIEGGPEEDCAWKKTNGSYDEIISKLGRAPGSPSVKSAVESDKPIDMKSVGAPDLAAVPAPESDSL